MQERLQKIIAQAGLASRRAAEEIIVAGRVRVNGRVVSELGAKADPRTDRIEVDGQRLVAEDLHYIVLHKPRNVVSTLKDPEGRPTVADYLRDVPARVYPVGRLDFATSGVLLMTNDGEFANALLHPRGGVPKTYVLKVQGEMSEHDVDAWRRGVQLEDGITLPARARLLRLEGDKTWLEVTLREGRNQQLRRMGDATGWRVMRLARLSFAGITAEDLRPGTWRPLTRDELLAVRKEFGVPRKIKAATIQAPAQAPGRPHGRPQAPRSEGRSQAARSEGRPQAARSEGRPQARSEGRPQAARSEGRPQAARSEGRPQAARSEGRPQAARSERSDRSGTTPRAAARPATRARGREGR
jgi:23S rRNA pseudouridine2605 synthase